MASPRSRYLHSLQPSLPALLPPETEKVHDGCQPCSHYPFGSPNTHRVGPASPAWPRASSTQSETGFNANLYFLACLRGSWAVLQVGKLLLYREKAQGPERRGLAQGTQKVNDRTTDPTDSSFRGASWMATFPTLSSPPSDKCPLSSMLLVFSVSLDHISSSEAARFTKHNKNFGVIVTLEFHTCYGTLDKFSYFSGLIFLTYHGILIFMYLMRINEKLGSSLI